MAIRLLLLIALLSVAVPAVAGLLGGPGALLNTGTGRVAQPQPLANLTADDGTTVLTADDGATALQNR